MRRLFPLLPLFLLVTACASTMSNSDADAYIRSAGPRFITAFNAGNSSGVSSFYTDDAVMLTSNAPMARGPAGIGSAYNSFLTSMHPVLNFAPDRIVQSCDMAYEYGHYTMQVTPPGGSAQSDQGNYVTVWRRQPNGDWKIVADSVNSSVPMAGMH
jgi:ketosteroid isomerase-like protein